MSALVAAVIALGALGSASAAVVPPRDPSPASPAVDAEAGAEAELVLHASLEHLRELVAAGLLPPQALQALERAIERQEQQFSPGFTCRRVALADDAPAELVERCRAHFAGGPAQTLRQLCARVAASGLEGPRAERCRNALAQLQDGELDPYEVCRRLVAAGLAEQHPERVERCRAILAGETVEPLDVHPCRRALRAAQAGEPVPDEVRERCGALAQERAEGAGEPRVRVAPGTHDPEGLRALLEERHEARLAELDRLREQRRPGGAN